ncbi:glyoxylase-like metal-dependent hydrolase (beta-lactamase superfamily II) [Paenibacillus shirakamiensis]|uniref:Glyoxylase-like metal-dependent hydrolase (Beta-lactamase superfamily II) n=1 Tax=Paenibacillus shirakamiensis TaxID=1265935 RepID=A0ABS4JK68_9BACL|nr:MBL fold metallo-hydrolase [Paenibacillus shirakamiensis]MBP2001496.1 glyoxylase-like metal-dependent hydrolase (beta-lactamase superfamily II) [Paenibacillus shirakamiensis]
MITLPKDLSVLKTLIVNVVMVGQPGSPEWVLIDAGIPGFAHAILEQAEERFGKGIAPKAILLTHGHFDHLGSLEKLLDSWDVPIYVSTEEIPYVTGMKDYPKPDPEVGGGLMSMVSPLYPYQAYDFGERVRPLPEDGSIPFMQGWHWISTPGHTPGHISLYRESDRTLIAGDAFITVKQESAFAVLTQEVEVHGPPTYFTPDWEQARISVQRLAALRPELAITGHGLPLSGSLLRTGLEELARDFEKKAIPEHGRYVPPKDESKSTRM